MASVTTLLSPPIATRYDNTNLSSEDLYRDNVYGHPCAVLQEFFCSIGCHCVQCRLKSDHTGGAWALVEFPL